MFKVHLLDELEPPVLADLRRQLDPDILITTGTELPNHPNYHILVAGRPEPKYLHASPELKAVVIPWAGIPEATLKLVKELKVVTLHNLHHNAAPTAELGLALLFAAAKFIVPFDQELRQGNWTRRYQPSPALLLSGKKILVLGLGEIGQRIARVCLALEMEVFAVRRQLRPAPGDLARVHVYLHEELSRLLAECQAVIITLPLTVETRGLIGADQLDSMPDDSILVNIGRGPIVDQKALYRALVTGKLAAAGLDVWYNYPHTVEERLHTLPSIEPMHTLPNVVLSPHRGGDSRDIEELRMEHLAALINAAARGDPIPNQVNLELGY